MAAILKVWRHITLGTYRTKVNLANNDVRTYFGEAGENAEDTHSDNGLMYHRANQL